MAKTINTESFIEAWEGERCLWDVNSVIYKLRRTFLHSDSSSNLNSCTSVS